MIPRDRLFSRRLPEALASLGLVSASWAVLDQRHLEGAVIGLTLGTGALVLGRLRGRSCSGLILAWLLTLSYSVSAGVRTEFRADAASYFVYLRSVVFDGDLDFTNEWSHWGYAQAALTPTGLRANSQSIGPSLLWSPFYLAAHGYVRTLRALGDDRYAAEGYGAPYVQATALGTIAAVVLGAWLLARTIASTSGRGAAVLAVLGTVLASPVLYYTFVLPTMAHGAAFGATAAFVWAWHRACSLPTLQAWVCLGALLGLATLVRWQAIVLVSLVLLLAAEGLVQRTLRTTWLLAAGAAGAIVFAPQVLVWRTLYGRPFTIPQGSGFVDWSSPHLLDTLISADHGLFTWTPVLFFGLVGLVLGLRTRPLLHAGALFVFTATAWVNGGVRDWAASDAYGARRYDIVFPFLALGLASLIASAARWVARIPLLAPGAALLLLALWNLGFIALFRAGHYPEMAPLERLAKDQARNLRLAAQGMLGGVLGPSGRALAYKLFSGEYLYTRFNPRGRIDLAAAGEAELLHGWGTRGRRTEGPAYRWALFPEACLRVPLDEPFELPYTVTARAPRQAEDQVMTVVMNGEILQAERLGEEWQEVKGVIPERVLLAGENDLCLRFRLGAPGEEGSRVAAAVASVQLP